MAETITQFIQSIENERKRSLAQKTQAMMPYLDYLYKIEDERETLDKHRNDYITTAKANGYDDDAIGELQSTLSGISNPGAMGSAFDSFRQRKQAIAQLDKRKVQYDPKATTEELARQAGISLQEEDHNRAKSMKRKDDLEILDTEGKAKYKELITAGIPEAQAHAQARTYSDAKNKAQLMGSRAAKMFDEEYKKSNDPETALGETARRMDLAKGSGKPTKAEKPNYKSYIHKSQGDDFVYFKGSKGQIVKARVYIGDDGKLRYAANDAQVDTNRLELQAKIDSKTKEKAKEAGAYESHDTPKETVNKGGKKQPTSKTVKDIVDRY